MSARTSYRSTEEGFRQLATIINLIIKGKAGDATLTAAVTSTVINDSRIGIDSVITLTPTTANAAAESFYITNVTAGAFTINHANAASTDRAFKYTIEG